MNEHLSMDVKPFDWYGGKGHMASEILPYIPDWREIYCEPFGGGASLFFNMPARPIEVYNDIDSRLVNFFRVLQKEKTSKELRMRLENTLYSYEEYLYALSIVNNAGLDSVEMAWAFFIVYNSSYSGTGKSAGNWSINKSKSDNRIQRFRKRIDALDVFRQRFLNIFIDHMDAVACIKKWDTPKTFFYLDPPYHAETRRDTNVYNHETSDDLHVRLVECMLASKGMFLLSCYWHDVYMSLIDAGYKRVDFHAISYAQGIHGDNNRIEVMLISPNVKTKQLKMF